MYVIFVLITCHVATARKYIPGYTSTEEWTNARSKFVKQIGGAITLCAMRPVQVHLALLLHKKLLIK